VTARIEVPKELTPEQEATIMRAVKLAGIAESTEPDQDKNT
jgi:hypothetical protein